MRRRTLSRLCMVLCFTVVAVLAWVQLSRAAQISANSKRISACRAEISQLTIDTQHLQIQISAKANLDRVRDTASDLGMVAAGPEQIMLVTLPAGYGDTVVAQVPETPNAG